ncbi:MAG TPA: DinB family protein [Thermoanaerobaculia bacterium]|jgi:uncharacterized damage-inducible protein DinB
MALTDALLAEFEHEMKTTRRLLERVPAERGDWKPHDKSSSLSQLALHVAHIPFWMTMTLKRTELDAAAPAEKRTLTTTEALLAEFDRKVADACDALTAATAEDLQVPWTLRAGDHVVFTMPRAATVRTFVMNHLIHHRGQLSVYLRLLDVPLPSIYGPSADEH